MAVKGLNTHDAFKQHFAFLKNEVIFWNLVVLEQTFSKITVHFFICNSLQIIFIHYKSRIASLQVENCDSNSRLVVDEDDNGNFRLKRVLMNHHLVSRISSPGELPYWTINCLDAKTLCRRHAQCIDKNCNAAEHRLWKKIQSHGKRISIFLWCWVIFFEECMYVQIRWPMRWHDVGPSVVDVTQHWATWCNLTSDV